MSEFCNLIVLSQKTKCLTDEEATAKKCDYQTYRGDKPLSEVSLYILQNLLKVLIIFYFKYS